MKKQKYKIKPNKEQREIIKECWKLFCKLRDKHWEEIGKLEKQMEFRTGIKGIEFFHSDIGWAGVGNADRTMALIQMDPV